MSKYTTEIRHICESVTGHTESQGYNEIDNIISAAAPIIFDFNFPIFDEDYRLALEIKILKYYYTREICEETYALWKLRLCNKLNKIMPYYNQLYKSELLEFNPMYDTDYRKTHEGSLGGNRVRTADITRYVTGGDEVESEGTNHGVRTRTGNEWNKYSATPQGSISNVDVEQNAYLTDVRNINSSNSETYNDSAENSGTRRTTHNETAITTDTDEVQNTDAYIERISGKTNGISYSKLLAEFRKTFLNIDSMILDDLSDLFFGLWE